MFILNAILVTPEVNRHLKKMLNREVIGKVQLHILKLLQGVQRGKLSYRFRSSILSSGELGLIPQNYLMME